MDLYSTWDHKVDMTEQLSLSPTHIHTCAHKHTCAHSHTHMYHTQTHAHPGVPMQLGLMSEKRGKCVKRERILGKRIRRPEGERTDSHSPLRPQVTDLLLLSPPNWLHSRGQECSFRSHSLASLFAKETRTTFKYESYFNSTVQNPSLAGKHLRPHEAIRMAL